MAIETARLMLRSANARGYRCGSSVLWDARDVRALAEALRVAGLAMARRLPDDEASL